MPRSFEKAVRHPNREVVDAASRQARAELQRAGQLVPQVLVAPEPAGITVLDGDGNEVERHVFMLGVDALGDPAARLKVNGRPRKYFRR